MNKNRILQIINEEIDRAIKMQEMAMPPSDRFGRREIGDIEGSGGGVAPSGPLPGMMSYRREKVAYIEPNFQKKEGIFTIEDFKQAYDEGRARLWIAGEFGAGQPPSYTIVPAGASAKYDKMTGMQGYPYAYTMSAKDEMGRRTDRVKTVVLTGVGSGSGAGPRPAPNSIIPTIQQFFTDIVPLPLLSMREPESDPALELPEGEIQSGMNDLDALSESIMNRWNKAAGLLK